MNTSLIQNLSLVLGATILSVFGSNLLYYFPEGSRRHIVLIFFGIGFLLYGFGVIEKLLSFIIKIIRDSSFSTPKIGILCGVSRKYNERITTTWSDITPEEWYQDIQAVVKAAGKKVKIQLIYSTDSFDSYNAILNPFGGNYPETSFDGFPVYKKLLRYIRSGGLFINIADIPTYWAYNPHIKRMLDRTPAIYGATGEETRFFRLTPLMQELALKLLNVEKYPPEKWPVRMTTKYSFLEPGITDILASRAITIEGNVESIIEPKITEDFSLTPLFFCNYGNGRCLISLSFLNGIFNDNRPLKDLICKLIIEELTT